MTDPIADLLTRIRNALQAGHEAVEVPYSRMREEIVKILRQEGYITAYKIEEKSPCSILTVVLKYDKERRPVIRTIQRVSKPGRRVYVGRDEISQVLGGMGISILSTSRGLMTGREARSAGIGGEVLCDVH